MGLGLWIVRARDRGRVQRLRLRPLRLIVPAMLAFAIFAAFFFEYPGLSRRMAAYTREARTLRLPCLPRGTGVQRFFRSSG